MARAKAPPVIELDKQAVEQMLVRAQAVLVASDFDIVKHLVDTILYLVREAQRRHPAGGWRRLADGRWSGDERGCRRDEGEAGRR